MKEHPKVVTRRRHARTVAPPGVLKTSGFTLGDLSEGGAMLHSLERYEVGVEIPLTLAVSSQPFNVTARVEWWKPRSSYELGHFTGIQFTNPSQDQRTQIGQHLLAEARRQDSTAQAAFRMRQQRLRIELTPGVFTTEGFEARELSESGMMLMCRDELPIGSTFAVELELNSKRVWFNAQVRWRRPTPHEPGYRLGTQFMNLPEYHQELLRTYVANTSAFVDLA